MLAHLNHGPVPAQPHMTRSNKAGFPFPFAISRFLSYQTTTTAARCPITLPRLHTIPIHTTDT